jgi:hypothetical protein
MTRHRRAIREADEYRDVEPPAHIERLITR